MNSNSHPLIGVVGQTASGKSAVALELASLLNAEIVVADSMQVYREANIATAKPSPLERSQIPHHCVDLVEPTESFSTAQWLETAQQAIKNIYSRQHAVLLVGGTGLYIRALVRGLDAMPSTPQPLKEELAQIPLPDLIAELHSYSPENIGKLDLNNRRRVERAVAILRLGGKLHQKKWQLSSPLYPFFTLHRSREDLIERMNRRVDWMFANGLVEEYKKLRLLGLSEKHTLWQALGYRQIHQWQTGEIDEEQCREQIKKQTRQFSKRQATWFKKEPGIIPLETSANESPSEIAQRILNFLKS